MWIFFYRKYAVILLIQRERIKPGRAHAFCTRSQAPALIVIRKYSSNRHTRREAGIQCQGW